MAYRLWRLAVATTLVLALVPSGQAHAVFPGANGKIAFMVLNPGEHEGFANEDIVVVNPDGSGLQQLTTFMGNDLYPAWSPDGSKIAFSSTRGGKKVQIYVMNSDGSGVVQVTSVQGGQQDLTPAFSPDGTQIVFARITNSKGGSQAWHLFIVGIDGGGLRQLTTGSNVFDTYPSWSPDGQQIVFSRREFIPDSTDYSTAINKINVDSSGLTRLTPLVPDSDDQDPDWSPDGQRIVFFRGGAAAVSGVYTIGPNGENETLVVERGQYPSWSPDGTRIVYSGTGISSINPDGTGAEVIVPPGTVSGERNPVWQPT